MSRSVGTGCFKSLNSISYFIILSFINKPVKDKSPQVDAEGDEKRRLELEQCGREYWQLYVNWAVRLRNEEEADAVAELKRFMAKKSFKGLKFNI